MNEKCKCGLSANIKIDGVYWCRECYDRHCGDEDEFNRVWDIVMSNLSDREREDLDMGKPIHGVIDDE